MIVSHMTYKDIEWILLLGASEHISVLSRLTSVKWKYEAAQCWSMMKNAVDHWCGSQLHISHCNLHNTYEKHLLNLLYI